MLTGEENYTFCLSSRKLVRWRRPLKTAALVGPNQDRDQVAGLFPEQLPGSPEPFRNHCCTRLFGQGQISADVPHKDFVMVNQDRWVMPVIKEIYCTLKNIPKRQWDEVHRAEVSEFES